MAAGEQPCVNVWEKGLRCRWLEVETHEVLKAHGLKRRKKQERGPLSTRRHWLGELEIKYCQ